MYNNNSDDKSKEHLISIIQKNKIFADIERQACENLIEKLISIQLNQGDVLFEQGQPSDCLYILAKGQMIASLETAEGNHKVIGSIDVGEIVGEFGVISKQPRSLTIRAIKDSILLKLTKTQFDAFCKENTKFITRIIDLIILRSQNSLKIISQNKLYKHVAIIKGDDSLFFDIFINKLKENFSDQYDLILHSDIEKEISVSHVFSAAESLNKSIIFILDENIFSKLQSELNHIGSVYIVVDGDNENKLSDFAFNILKKHKILFTHANQFELVLLHNDSIKLASNTEHWLKQAEFTLHHHIRLNTTSDYQRLMRFMMGKVIGLVLGGGGNNGWVSLGAIKALVEAKFPIDIIGGSSVGSIAGSCYILNLDDYQKTEEVFEKLILSNENPFSLKNLTWPIISLISAQRPTQILQGVYKNILIEDLLLPFFAVTSNLSSGKEVVFRYGKLWEALRASVSMPGIAPPMVIDGELYLDGGLVNNLPVDDMRNLLGNDSTIIAVSLTNSREFNSKYHFPPILPFRVGFFRRLKLAFYEYTFPSYFNTFVHAMLLGSSTKEKANQLAADILISPDLTQFKTLAFSSKNKNELIEIGYNETMQKIKEYRARSNKWKYKYE